MLSGDLCEGGEQVEDEAGGGHQFLGICGKQHELVAAASLDTGNHYDRTLTVAMELRAGLR